MLFFVSIVISKSLLVLTVVRRLDSGAEWRMLLFLVAALPRGGLIHVFPR